MFHECVHHYYKKITGKIGGGSHVPETGEATSFLNPNNTRDLSSHMQELMTITRKIGARVDATTTKELVSIILVREKFLVNNFSRPSLQLRIFSVVVENFNMVSKQSRFISCQACI